MKLQTINASASPEVQMNENFDAIDAVAMFGRKSTTTTGLTWGFYGGILYVDGVATTISDATVVLTASQTNYIERTRAGAVSANISGFTAGRIPLYTAVTGSASITSYIDQRDYTTVFQESRVGITVTTSDVTLSAAEARVDEIKATGTLTGNRSIIVPTVAWAYIVDNQTAGAFALTVKTAAGAGVTVTQGTAEIVYCDGTDVKRALSGLTLAALTLTGTLTLSGTAANIATGANFISYAGTDAGFSLDASNNATLSANLTVSGGQIAFPATQVPSANVNTLDDYEEGTWTPAITFGGGATGVTYGAQLGVYTKIGRLVHITGVIVLTSKGSSVGTAVISGLPFNASATVTLTPMHLQAITYTGTPTGYLESGTTNISPEQTTEAGTRSNMTDTNFSNNSELSVNFCYYV